MSGLAKIIFVSVYDDSPANNAEGTDQLDLVVLDLGLDGTVGTSDDVSKISNVADRVGRGTVGVAVGVEVTFKGNTVIWLFNMNSLLQDVLHTTSRRATVGVVAKFAKASKKENSKDLPENIPRLITCREIPGGRSYRLSKSTMRNYHNYHVRPNPHPTPIDQLMTMRCLLNVETVLSRSQVLQVNLDNGRSVLGLLGEGDGTGSGGVTTNNTDGLDHIE